MNTQIQDTATPTGEPVDKVLERPQPVSFRQAFWFWLKLGFISFGGPAGADRHHAHRAGGTPTLDQ